MTVAATKNISEVTQWHDIAGYTIVALVFVGPMALGVLARPRNLQMLKWQDRHGTSPTDGDASPAESEHRSRSGCLSGPQCLFAAALCWLFLQKSEQRHGIASTKPILSAPRVGVCNGPNRRPNFRKLNIDPEIRGVLRFDEGKAAAWTLTSPSSSENALLAKASGTQVNGSRENAASCLLYVFRWKPGRNSALLANLHRPDVCLPASGWTQVADDGVRNYPVSGAFQLPFRHFEFQRAFEKFRAADSACLLLFIGRSRFGTFFGTCPP